MSSTPVPEGLREDVPLADKTTLGLGGSARFYLQAHGVDEVRGALRWAQERGLEVRVLGGGSNLIVPDEGVDGLVIDIALSGFEELSSSESFVRVRAGAGLEWDGFVAQCLPRGCEGIECLSGIPGRVGGTPIQNVGAYGQEVAETIAAVQVIDRRTLEVDTLPREQCEFAYRSSRFKREPGRYVVVGVIFEFRAGGAPTVRHAELRRRLEPMGEATLADVRREVLRLRREKSMVLDPNDPDSRSAGSFFVNPIVTRAEAERVFTSFEGDVPHWPTKDDRVKLAAGWLIEHAGVTKGMRRGPVGISRAHALALVHHGGGSTDQLLELADEVRATVANRFGIELVREPVLWG